MEIPFFFFFVKNSKKLGIPIFFVLKMIEYFGNSHVFFTHATKKVLILGGLPNEKCGSNFWDSQVFFRGCASNFWNSLLSVLSLFEIHILSVQNMVQSITEGVHISC